MTNQQARVVLVTGGTRGIGAAVAAEFQAQGARVIVTGTQPSPQVPQGLECLAADFANETSLRAFCGFIEALPRLDVCVNNAGMNIIKPLDAVLPEDFDRLTAIDYRAPYMVAQSAARVMRRARRGWIVNIGSIWSVITKRGRTLYTAAKTGLVGMTRAMAVELAPEGILVNCLSPGFVMTELTRQSLSAAEMETLAAQVPLGRFAEPAEVARYVAFLASEQNTYLTGQNIVVDGGFTNV